MSLRAVELRLLVFGVFCVLGSVVVDVLVFGLGSMLLAVFLSRVIRFNCFVSDFVMEECSLVFVSLVGG